MFGSPKFKFALATRKLMFWPIERAAKLRDKQTNKQTKPKPKLKRKMILNLTWAVPIAILVTILANEESNCVAGERTNQQQIDIYIQYTMTIVSNHD